MDLPQLEMLLAVVEAGSYAKAGERLNISHSAIHRQIRLLEHEIEDRLLVRKGRGVELTDSGRVLVDTARRIRMETAHAFEHIRERNNLQRGSVRIGTGTTMLVFFLPQVLEHFRARYPGVQLNLMTGTAEQVLIELAKGALDLGIIFSDHPSTLRPRGLLAEALYEEEFVFAVDESHPLASEKAVPLETMALYPLSAFTATSHIRNVVEGIFRRAGCTARVSMEIDNEEAMQKLVEIGMGPALMARRRAVAVGLPYFRIAGHPVVAHTTLVWPDSEYLSRASREFSNVCREIAKEFRRPEEG